jgi:glycosyltransferase involved in cell wall biosynthesis
MTRISIIMPTYNREQFIGEAIQSVLDQSFQDYELIIGDDGSTDNTKRIVESFNSPRIKYLKLEHFGRSHARNEALKYATGDYISFLDSDDVFLLNKLEFQANCLDNEPDIALVYSSVYEIDDNGNGNQMLYPAVCNGDVYYSTVFFFPYPMFPSVWLIRTQVVKEAGLFDENLDRYEDIDFFRRISKKYKVQGIYQPLLKFRKHAQNSLENQDPNKMFKDITFYVEKVFREDIDRNANLLSVAAANFYFKYGKFICSIPRFRKSAIKFFIKAIKYYKFSRLDYSFLCVIIIVGLATYSVFYKFDD